MRVCICGSMSVIDRIERLAETLREAGHEVVTPARDDVDGRWHELALDDQIAVKRRLIDDHVAEVRRADLVLVANVNSAGIEGRVGSNALVEAAFAKAVGVPVVLLERAGPQPCQLEILALQDGCLDSDLSGIDAFER
jgi:hypothetical protein